MRAISGVDQIDVDVHGDGNITITQKDRETGEEGIVWLPYDRVKDLCNALRRAEKKARESAQGGSERG